MKLKSQFQIVVRIFLNTILLLFLINFVAIAVMSLYYYNRSIDHVSSLSMKVRDLYELENVELNELLSATWEYGWEYEPVVGFREVPRDTKYVHVNEFGFRDKVSGNLFLDRLNGSIWFLGGSTTFGYGVSDTQTIPAFVEEITETDTVNLGRGYYFSEQENLVLSKLLNWGIRPREVIFLDGPNERCFIEQYQNEIGKLFSEAQSPFTSVSAYIFDISKPSLELLQKFIGRFSLDMGPEDDQNPSRDNLECQISDREYPLKVMVASNLRVRNAICTAFDIKCTTFVSPFPGVHGVHEDYNSLPADTRNEMKQKYEHLTETYDNYGAVSLVSALDTSTAHSFIDGVHFSPDANKLIAKRLTSLLN